MRVYTEEDVASMRAALRTRYARRSILGAGPDTTEDQVERRLHELMLAEADPDEVVSDEGWLPPGEWRR